MRDFLQGISVIIPYYNGQKYIHKNLESLLEALKISNLSYEIIIVNDFSDLEIDFFTKSDSEIKIIKNERNLGVAASRNVGLSVAKFSYICFIDQDDWVEEDFFKSAKKYIDQQYQFIFYNYIYYYENENRYSKRNYNVLFTLYYRFITAKSLIKYACLFRTPGQFIVNRNIINEFVVPSTPGADDYYYYIDLFYKKDIRKIKYIHQPFFIFRIHNTNFSKKADFSKSSLECFNEYEKKNKEVIKYKKYLLKRYSGNILLTFYIKVLHKILMI